MKNSVLTLEAGIALLLEKISGEPLDGHPIWISRFNHTKPEVVIQAHLELFRNGAEIVKANNYQASIEGYMEFFGLNEEESYNLIKSTVGLTLKARDLYLKETGIVKDIPRVFSSIGSYLACMHDGSEYTGKYPDHANIEFLKKWHLRRIRAVVDGGVEGFFFETIPSLLEGEILVDLIMENYPQMPFVLCFQGKSPTSIANDEKFAYVAEKIWNKAKAHKNHNLLAIGVNCVDPTFVGPLLKSVKASRSAADKIPLCASPNSGEKYDTEKKIWYGKEMCPALENFVPNWVEQGAVMIGGCCRSSIEDIGKIKRKIEIL